MTWTCDASEPTCDSGTATVDGFSEEEGEVIEGTGAIESIVAFTGEGGSFFASTGAIEALLAFDGIGASVAAQQETAYSGGWTEFSLGYDRELHRRRQLQQELAERSAQTQQITDPVSKEIGEFLRKQEAEDERRQELERLKVLASRFKAQQAKDAYGQRVAKALERAVEKQTFSALEALDRELQRAQEEEEFLIIAAIQILDD